MLSIVRACAFMLIMSGVCSSALASPDMSAHHEASLRQSDQVLQFEAWSRATPGAVRTAAVYGSMTNLSQQKISVYAVTASNADRIMVHDTILADGMMRMRHQETVIIDAGDALILAPGGLHLMLTGLQAPLKENEQFEITLGISVLDDSERPEKSRIEMTSKVIVMEVGSMGPGMTGSTANTDMSAMEHHHH
ncbi:MAG: copper chaperone PCu(A)C [Pseudomonadota bacterium]